MKAYLQRPLNEEFSDSYLQSGLRPSTGVVSPIRNVSVSEKNDPTLRRGGKAALKTTGTAMQVTGVVVETSGKATSGAGRAAQRAGMAMSATGVGAIAGVPLAVAGTGMVVGGKAVQVAGKATRRVGTQINRSSSGIVGSSIARAKATRTNFTIWAWGLFIWTTCQLPFAIATVIFLGIVQVVADIINYITPNANEEGTSFWASIGSKLFSSVLSVADLLFQMVKWLTGIDLYVFNPANFAMLTYMITWAIGISTLLAIGMIYLFAGFNSLSGRGASLKLGTFLVAFIGYSIPLLNIFPWFIFWTMAVWRYPK